MHPDDDRLHDYVDDALDDGARAELERHLAACDDCAAHANRLRALLRRAAAAPRELAPARDLWPAIAAEVSRRGAPARPRPAGGDSSGGALRRPLRGGWGRLAAAAVLLVAASSLITALVMRAGAPVAGRSAAGPGVAESVLVREADFRAAEERYAREAASLQRTLEARRDSLAPETVRIVERSLRVIDDAIAEARAALARDPGNAAIREMLEATWRQKVDFLRRSTDLPRSA